jgi:catechol 2,3-dioxygenase-like lactoylglutathione lyase family enzyme
MQLDHINLSTPGDLMEAVKDFYCEVLGFAVGPRPDIPIPGYWLYHHSGGGASIHLIESDQHRPPDGNYLDHVAFRVPSVEAVRERLEERQVEYRELKLEELGIHQVVVTDPAGTKVEITAPRDPG